MTDQGLSPADKQVVRDEELAEIRHQQQYDPDMPVTRPIASYTFAPQELVEHDQGVFARGQLAMFMRVMQLIGTRMVTRATVEQALGEEISQLNLLIQHRV